MANRENPKQFYLNWTPEQIEYFWDWAGNSPAYKDEYFSQMVGDSVIRGVGKVIQLKGIVVDLGAGPGFLVEKLLHRDVSVIALDTSLDSINKINEMFKTRSNFIGAWKNSIDRLPLEDNIANIVIAIEFIEHLDDNALNSMLSEISRITKPGGYIVITTPNEENLSKSQTICPNCGCIFHTVQHLRSFSHSALNETMIKYKIKPIVCKPTLFSQRHAWLQPLQIIKLRFMGEKLPHLFFIGIKIT